MTAGLIKNMDRRAKYIADFLYLVDESMEADADMTLVQCLLDFYDNIFENPDDYPNHRDEDLNFMDDIVRKNKPEDAIRMLKEMYEALTGKPFAQKL